MGLDPSSVPSEAGTTRFAVIFKAVRERYQRLKAELMGKRVSPPDEEMTCSEPRRSPLFLKG